MRDIVFEEKNTLNLERKTPNLDEKDAAAFLRRQRELQGLTQEQLAEKTGLHINTIGLFENGKLYSDPVAEKIARALGYGYVKSIGFPPLKK